ncbi:Retrovirus-related Pol polyprotein from transposon RE1 [Cardamine amara subsp. amara]|uniref:Retrovirus-related Pol polyprotein from transposon RE1 n=1 Tax=Cardamine amara subsp. amara TaxID=228776 RepID=A0ABD1BM12_CARAN
MPAGKWTLEQLLTSRLNLVLSTLSLIVLLFLIIVGNGSLLPALASGHTCLTYNSRPLHLNNVLLCPQILKNLISVQQFTIDNICSVEFDPFGFLVKDLCTRAPLIRCDSTGPLYAVTPSSPSISP